MENHDIQAMDPCGYNLWHNSGIFTHFQLVAEF